MPLAYGLRCAQVPSLRSRSVGPPPRAIHGPSRLSRHPCRSTHSTEPPLGLPMGRVDQDQKLARRPTGRPVGVSVCCAIFVAAEERSEAAIGCEAVAKSDTWFYQIAPGLRFYGRFAADRSLASLVSGYRKTVKSSTYLASASNCDIGFALTASHYRTSTRPVWRRELRSTYLLCGSRACPRCRHLVLSG